MADSRDSLQENRQGYLRSDITEASVPFSRRAARNEAGRQSSWVAIAAGGSGGVCRIAAFDGAGVQGRRGPGQIRTPDRGVAFGAAAEVAAGTGDGGAALLLRSFIAGDRGRHDLFAGVPGERDLASSIYAADAGRIFGSGRFER